MRSSDFDFLRVASLKSRLDTSGLSCSTWIISIFDGGSPLLPCAHLIYISGSGLRVAHLYAWRRQTSSLVVFVYCLHHANFSLVLPRIALFTSCLLHCSIDILSCALHHLLHLGRQLLFVNLHHLLHMGGSFCFWINHHHLGQQSILRVSSPSSGEAESCLGILNYLCYITMPVIGSKRKQGNNVQLSTLSEESLKATRSRPMIIDDRRKYRHGGRSRRQQIFKRGKRLKEPGMLIFKFTKMRCYLRLCRRPRQLDP